MLSILVPVFNYDVLELISDINKQCIDEEINFEIIVIEDGSSKLFKNSEINNIKNAKHEVLEKNIGRSKIRNILADKAEFDNLIYMDCDSEINPKFIKNYISYLDSKNDYIVCGGREYTSEPESDDYILHWKYGIEAESKPAIIRNSNPNKSFMTNNFLISKSLFNKIRFNEEIITYGHEDTLFGYELKKLGIIITHIDNPVVHIGLETNTEFLEKTKLGLENLMYIYKMHKSDKDFTDNISLLKLYNKFIFFAPIISFVFKLLEPLLVKNILSKNPSIRHFSAYKFGYFCGIIF